MNDNNLKIFGKITSNFVSLVDLTSADDFLFVVFPSISSIMKLMFKVFVKFNVLNPRRIYSIEDVFQTILENELKIINLVWAF